jgi:hypothetical protein
MLNKPKGFKEKSKKEKVFTKQFIIGLILGIIFGIVGTLLVMYIIAPFIDNKIIGPKIETYVYDNLDYSSGSPAFVLDVENKGGTTLYNLSANIEYSCENYGFNISGNRTISPRILPKGQIMEFSFADNRLVNEIEQSEIPCSDVTLSLFHVKKIYSNVVQVIEGYLVNFELAFENSKIGTHIISIKDLKNETEVTMCSPCRIKYSINSDTASDSGYKEVRTGSANIGTLLKINDTLDMSINSTDKWLITPLTLYKNCGPIYCADLPYQALKMLYPDITSNSIILTTENDCLVAANSSKTLYISGDKIIC